MKKELFAFLAVTLFFAGDIILAEESSEEKQERWQVREDARIPQQSMDSLNNRFANETKLTDAEKNELISCFKDEYQKNIPYRDELYSGNVAFFEKIANNQNLTQEQKKAAIKSHFAEQQANMK